MAHDGRSREQVIRQTIARFGVRLQSTVCMEECAELIQAISRRLRDKPDPDGNLAEEMADVTICLRMLQLMYDVSNADLDEWIGRKIRRQKARNVRMASNTGKDGEPYETVSDRSARRKDADGRERACETPGRGQTQK